jgi:hypothetical protein
MRVSEENLPSIGSYWLSPAKKRVRVMMVTNKRAQKEGLDYPLIVVGTDGSNARDQGQFWSLPLEQWKQTMTLIPPSQV